MVKMMWNHVEPFSKHKSLQIPVLALIFFVVAFILLAIGFGPSVSSFETHSLGMQFDVIVPLLGAWLSIIFVIWGFRQGRLDVFEFPVWFSLNVYFQMLVNIWLLQRKDYSPKGPFLAINPGHAFSDAVLLIGFGLTIMWSGYAWYYLNLQKRQISFSQVRYAPNLNLALLIWAGGWFLNAYGVFSGRSVVYGNEGENGTWANYFNIAYQVSLSAMFVLLLHYIRNPSPWRWVWIGFALISNIFLSLYIGSKSSVLFFVSIVMIYKYASKRMPWKLFALAGGIMIIVIVPIINTYRAELLRSPGHTEFPTRINMLGDVTQNVLSQPFKYLVNESQDSFELRQSASIQITAAILRAHPDTYPYIGPEQLELTLTTLIPRVIWWNKPTGKDLWYLPQTLYLGYDKNFSFASPGPFADAYRGGGLLFVIIWFWLLGALNAWLYFQAIERKNEMYLILYLFMLNAVFSYDTHIVSVVVHGIQYGISAWLVLRGILYVSPKRPSPLNIAEIGHI